MTVRIQDLSMLVLIGAVAACTGVVDGVTPAGGGGLGSVSNPNPGNGTGGGSVVGSGGAGSVAASGGAGAIASTPGKLNLTGTPQYFRFVRVTNTQWTNSVQSILALSAPTTLGENFREAVSGNSDFNNNELFLDIDNSSWADFQTASEALADQVTATDAALAKVYSGKDAAGLISTLGRRAYRRPLTTAEQATYLTLFNSGSALTGSRSALGKGASLVIRALLQSPNFLFRTELGAVGQPLTAFEMAAKLSLWLRDTTPSDALLDSAAGPGALGTADGAVALAKTMLDEDGAKAVMRRFHGQLLHLDQFSTITKSGVASFNAAIAPELTESSYLFFDKIFSKGLGVKDILLSTTGFVGPNMAAVYGGSVTAPSSGYSEQTLGPNRVGYFTQLPYLMYYGRNGTPDSIHRGVNMNFDVLCATLGPASIVLPTLPARQPGETNRQVVDKTTSGCGSLCHNALINPIGFAFEHYDGMGQYNATEKDVTGVDLPIDSSGTYAFTDGSHSYTDAAALMQVMATGQQAHACYGKKLASFGLQRDVVDADMPLVTDLATTSMSSGSVKQVMLELVKRDEFRTRSGGAQ
ncbi:MAG: DUF1592 domain-containing protein [Polyangiaceae bacterium]